MCRRTHPEIVARLTGLLEKYVADGRSTPGKPQANTGAVEFRSTPKANPGKKAGKAAQPKSGKS